MGVQELKNDWRLSQEDIDTIVAWVNAGSPLGNPEELPPPREYPKKGEWRLAADLTNLTTSLDQPPGCPSRGTGSLVGAGCRFWNYRKPLY